MRVAMRSPATASRPVRRPMNTLCTVTKPSRPSAIVTGVYASVVGARDMSRMCPMAAGRTSDDAVVTTRVPTAMAIGPVSGFNNDSSRGTDARWSAAFSLLSPCEDTALSALALAPRGRSIVRSTDVEPDRSDVDDVRELSDDVSFTGVGEGGDGGDVAESDAVVDCDENTRATWLWSDGEGDGRQVKIRRRT